jgi:hypothetical protein
MEAYPRSMRTQQTHPGEVETYPGATDAYPGAIVVHYVAKKANPGAMEAQSNGGSP